MEGNILILFDVKKQKITSIDYLLLLGHKIYIFSRKSEFFSQHSMRSKVNIISIKRIVKISPVATNIFIFLAKKIMDYISILGYMWGTLVVISLLPQTIKSRKTKSTKDISLRKYIIYCTWLVIRIIYAILIKNGPVAVMNSTGLVLALSILYLKIRYK